MATTENQKLADLHLNYKPFKTGKVRFEGVNLKTITRKHKLTFFGDTIKLTDTIGDDKISALTELGVLILFIMTQTLQLTWLMD